MLRRLEITVAARGAVLERGGRQEGDLLSLHWVYRVRAARPGLCVAKSQAERTCTAYRRNQQCARVVGSFARQELGHVVNSVIESALAGGFVSGSLRCLMDPFWFVNAFFESSHTSLRLVSRLFGSHLLLRLSTQASHVVQRTW